MWLRGVPTSWEPHNQATVGAARDKGWEGHTCNNWSLMIMIKIKIKIKIMIMTQGQRDIPAIIAGNLQTITELVILLATYQVFWDWSFRVVTLRFVFSTKSEICLYCCASKGGLLFFSFTHPLVAEASSPGQEWPTLVWKNIYDLFQMFSTWFSKYMSFQRRFWFECFLQTSGDRLFLLNAPNMFFIVAP